MDAIRGVIREERPPTSHASTHLFLTKWLPRQTGADGAISIDKPLPRNVLRLREYSSSEVHSRIVGLATNTSSHVKSTGRAFFSQVTNSPGTGALNAVVRFLIRFVDGTTYSFTGEKRPACCCAA